MEKEYVLFRKAGRTACACGPVRFIDVGDIVMVHGEFFEVIATYRNYTDSDLDAFISAWTEVYEIEDFWRKYNKHE